MDIKNKRIWVTGASSGIGEAVAKELAAQGANLILSARNEAQLEALRASLPNAESHIVVAIDLSKSEDIADIVAPVLKDIGRLDVLVNNGGISQRGLARDTLLDVQRQVMEVNYFGTVAMTQAVLPSMLENGGGMIVTVSSVAGKVGGQSMSGYSASKHAILGYMNCLRAEEALNGIKVLNICPGFVQTNISVNAMLADGQQYGKVAGSIANGIDVQTCAVKMVNAIRQEKDEVVIGKGISYWAPTIYRFFPGLFRRLSSSKNFRE
ncbi:SDR family oxidoreductase [Thalassotalea agarivorans]|uniref:Short-chain dehydrogenase n=1 Tax=Thalassotalea agarivorans TaxID=349064 RepID=A0A1I0B2X5_THASX|nr:SDR family oxidoreductase [Thalassotalea agarivorans]SET00430.1 Short-chain dehydrogenase [Thalassotalea agarivorans]